MASYTTDASGRVLMTSGAPLQIPAAQNVQGGLIEAASQKTLASQAASAANFKNLGGGQKGAGRRKTRRRRKVRRGGAQSLNMAPLGLPTANSVPGINADDVFKAGIDLKNQVVADKGYDHLRTATPIKMGGFRFRGAEDLYPGSGTEDDTKGRRKVNGRRGKRTHRRKRGKSTRRRSRKRRHI